MAATIEDALKTFLTSNLPLKALVEERVYPDAIPEDQTLWPCMTYSMAGGPDEPYISGQPNDLHRDTFEFMAEADKRSDAVAVRDLLASVFAGIACRGFWIGGIFVSGAIVSDRHSTTEAPADASERHDRQVRLQVVIIWERR